MNYAFVYRHLSIEHTILNYFYKKMQMKNKNIFDIFDYIYVYPVYTL